MHGVRTQARFVVVVVVVVVAAAVVVVVVVVVFVRGGGVVNGGRDCAGRARACVARFFFGAPAMWLWFVVVWRSGVRWVRRRVCFL